MFHMNTDLLFMQGLVDHVMRDDLASVYVEVSLWWLLSHNACKARRKALTIFDDVYTRREDGGHHLLEERAKFWDRRSGSRK